MDSLAEIDYGKVRDINDVILPDPFPDRDRNGEPYRNGDGARGVVTRLDRIRHGRRVSDRHGKRFLLMGYGAVQGTVVLRDRYRRMFYADGDMRMKQED